MSDFLASSLSMSALIKGSLSATFNKIGQAAVGAGKGVQNLGQFIDKNIGLKALSGVGKGVAKIGSALASPSGIMFLLNILTMVVEKMGYLEPYLEIFGALLEILGGAIIVAMLPAIEALIKGLTDPEFMLFLQQLGTVIGEVICVAVLFLVNVFKLLQPQLGDIIRALTITAFVLSLAIKWLMGGSPGLIPALEILISVIQPVITIFFNLITGAINLGQALQGLIKWLNDIFKTIGENLTAAGITGPSTTTATALSSTNPMDVLLAVLQGIVGGFGSMQTGGIITKSIIKRLDPYEAVIPLEKLKEYVPEFVSPSGGNITLNLYGNTDKKIIDEAIREIQIRKGLGLF